MQNIKILSISEDLKRFYKTNGFVALKNIVPSHMLIHLKENLTALIYQEVRFERFTKSESIHQIILNLNKIAPKKLLEIQIAASRLAAFHTIAGEICKYIPLITGKSEVVFLNALGFLFGIPDDKRLSYDWHQDGTYHSDREVIHVWLPIFESTSFSNGAMSVLEGSNREPLLEFEKVKVAAKGYTSNKPIDIEHKTSMYPELICSLELGDCLFFSDNLIHRSNLNTSDKCRIVSVMKFSQKPYFINDQSSIVGV